MKQQALWLLVGALSGAPVLAQEAPPPSPTAREPVYPGPLDAGTGGAGQPSAPVPGSEERPPGEQKELTARILGTSPGVLYVEGEQGAVIALRVTHATRVSGRRISREQSIGQALRQQFKPDDPVRARFDVRTHEDGTMENVATSLDRP